MGRRRKAWLMGEDGHRKVNGRKLPGYTVAWRDGGRYHTKTFLRKREARQFRDGLTRRFERESAGGLLPLTMGDAVGAFVVSMEGLAVRTHSEMGRVLADLIVVVGKDCLVASVRPEAIEKYLRGRRALAESTRAKHWRYLRRFFRWCRGRGYCERVPTDGVTVKPRAIPKEQIVLPTDAKIAKLIDEVDDPRLKVAVMIGLSTGLDRGVVADLTPENFDLEEGVVVTRRRKTRRSHPVTLRVPLHRALVDEVRGLLSQTPPGMPLFPEYRWHGWYRRARERAGPPWTELTVGDFRKIASGRLQRAGVSLGRVRELLGHGSVVTTASHYSPVDPELRKAIDELPLA